MVYKVSGEVIIYVLNDSNEDKILKTIDRTVHNIEADNYDQAFDIVAKGEIERYKDIAGQLFIDNGYDGSSKSIKRMIAFDDNKERTLIDFEFFN